MKLLIASLLIFGSTAWSAKILAILPVVSRSHYIWTRVLPLELASRGHQVTIVSPNEKPENLPNVTELFLERSYELFAWSFDYENHIENSTVDLLFGFYEWGELVCDHQLNTNGAKQLMKLAKTEKFDLILMETLVNECFYPFISEFGYPPVIGMSGFELPLFVNYMFGNTAPYAYVRSNFLTYSDRMTFIERLHNTLISVFSVLYRNYVVMPKFQKVAEKRFGHPVPSLLEMETQFSMEFANLILGIDFPRPLLPSIIPVGGMHVLEPKPLPKDLKDYLDNSKDGVIFFSLGSNLRSNELTPKAREAFLGAFSQLPQNILWKFESDTLPGKPNNVKTGKWLPQSDILAHPNVRLFISHCGLMSTIETINRGVPVIGIPFFADQHTNMERLKSFGMAEYIEFEKMTKETLLETINKVLHTPSYTENAKKISSIFRDQPQTPLERAVFWTEYVLRHKGAPHLRSAALDLYWYEYFLLDVIAVLILATVFTLWVIYLVIRSVLRLICGGGVHKKTKRE